METLANELKLKILKEAAPPVLRRLVLSNVKVSPEYYSPMCYPIAEFAGVRLRDGSFAIDIDINSLPRDGIVEDDMLDIDALDEYAVLTRRTGGMGDLCFDRNMRHVCMYEDDHYWATSIGTISVMSHAMKSPLASVCKEFRSIQMLLCVYTTCVVPHKQDVWLNSAYCGTKLQHTIILADEPDPELKLQP
jgi:hypothetical protein